MKKLLLLIVLPLMSFADEIDGIVARVGLEAILKSEVETEIRRMGASLDVYETVLEEMINRKLILKAASEAKLTLQDWVVDSRVREIIDRAFNGDRNQLMKTLSQQKISYTEWYAHMKEDMLISAMRWNVIDKYVVISPVEMREEYSMHPDRYSVGDKVSVSVILLKPEDANLRTEISNALKDADFAELARRYSTDSHAADGGLWKDVDPKETFKGEVCAEIAKMPKGTLSHWIEIDGWSFLLKKDDETKGRLLTFEEAYDEIEAVVRERATDKALKEWIKRLKADTFVKIY